MSSRKFDPVPLAMIGGAILFAVGASVFAVLGSKSSAQSQDKDSGDPLAATDGDGRRNGEVESVEDAPLTEEGVATQPPTTGPPEEIVTQLRSAHGEQLRIIGFNKPFESGDAGRSCEVVVVLPGENSSRVIRFKDAGTGWARIPGDTFGERMAGGFSGIGNGGPFGGGPGYPPPGFVPDDPGGEAVRGRFGPSELVPPGFGVPGAEYPGGPPLPGPVPFEGTRFEDVPDSSVPEDWSDVEDGIPAPVRRHLSRARDVINATPTAEKRELAQLTAEAERLLRGAGTARERTSIRRRFEDRETPLRRKIKAWSLERFQHPQPFRPSDLKVGEVGVVYGCVIRQVVDETSALVDLEISRPSSLDEFEENDGLLLPEGELGYGAGPLADFGEGPIGLPSNAGRVLLRGIETARLRAGLEFDDERPFRIVGLVEDRAIRSLDGVSAGVRHLVLEPYTEYDEVLEHAGPFLETVDDR